MLRGEGKGKKNRCRENTGKEGVEHAWELGPENLLNLIKKGGKQRSQAREEGVRGVQLELDSTMSMQGPRKDLWERGRLIVGV